MGYITTWADGYGRWYASVPLSVRRDESRSARFAIERELIERGDMSLTYRVSVEHREDATQDGVSVSIWRERD